MERAEFERLVAEGFETLPEHIRAKISNVALLVEDEPSRADREAQGLGEDETLLGLYKGLPLTARGSHYGEGDIPMPDTITIYRIPTLEMAEEKCPSEADHEAYREVVRRIVADTVWHEYAHHFGMDEDEVRKREEERGVIE